MEVEEEVIIEPTPTNLAVPVITEEQLTKVPSVNEIIPPIVPSIQDVSTDKVVTQIKFNEFTDVLKSDGQTDKELIDKPISKEPTVSYSSISNESDTIKILDNDLLSLNDLGITDLTPSPPAQQDSTDLSGMSDISNLLNIQTL